MTEAPNRPPPPPTAVPAGTNGLAIAALVLGIVGIMGLWVVGPILALVFGYVGKGQIDRSGGAEQGRGMAVAGIVLGWVGIGLHILFAILFVTVFVPMFTSGGFERLPDVQLTMMP